MVKPHRFLQPTDAFLLLFFWKANKCTLPCGIRLLFEVVAKIEVGRMQLPEGTVFEDTSVLPCDHMTRGSYSVSLHIDSHSYPSAALAYLRTATFGEKKINRNSIGTIKLLFLAIPLERIIIHNQFL